MGVKDRRGNPSWAVGRGWARGEMAPAEEQPQVMADH